MFSSRFMVSGLTFRYLIELNFVCGIPVSFFCMWLSSFPNHLLKRQSFSSLYILGSLEQFSSELGYVCGSSAIEKMMNSMEFFRGVT